MKKISIRQDIQGLLGVDFTSKRTIKPIEKLYKYKIFI